MENPPTRLARVRFFVLHLGGGFAWHGVVGGEGGRGGLHGFAWVGGVIADLCKGYM